MNKKIFSYVGYAIKSRKVVLGLDNIEKNKKCKVVLYSDTLSENGKEKITKLVEKNFFKGYCFDVEQIYPEHNCKVIGITDNNLSEAIIKEMEENF